jgi:hypothetical protein
MDSSGREGVGVNTGRTWDISRIVLHMWGNDRRRLLHVPNEVENILLVPNCQLMMIPYWVDWAKTRLHGHALRRLGPPEPFDA